jgi:hypothetical protein
MRSCARRSQSRTEFYRMRDRITRELIAKGFRLVAIEGDWPGRASGPLCSASGILAVRMDRLCAISHVDVAQQ